MTDNTSTTTDPSPTTGLMATGSDMTNTVTGVTQFLDDAGVKSVTIRNAPLVGNELPIRDQAISDFFARPLLVNHTTWATTDSRNSLLHIDAPGGRIKSYSPWLTKLKGFNLVRGTCVLRVSINANPFQQGKLLLCFIPCAAETTSLWRLKSLTSETVLPNVEIDCRETTVMLKVPYVTPFDYFNIDGSNDPDKSLDWGQFYLKVLSPLKVGASGSSTVDVSVYMSFEDMEFAAPVAYAQSGIPIKGKLKRSRNIKPMSVTGMEAEVQATGGSISKALSLGASVADKISSVPLMTNIATPASWLLRGASGVAAWFGWSKPSQDEPGTFVTRRMVPNMANATGTDLSASLSLFHDHSVNLGTLSDDNTPDEMSFNFLKSIPAYVTEFGWSTSNLSNDVLYETLVGPQAFYDEVTEIGSQHTLVTRYKPPFAYLTDMFQQYRGSINLIFKFVKTDYHSGRLLFIFYPVSTFTGTESSLDPAFAIKEIVDLRTQNEISLTFPYLLPNKYQQTQSYIGKLVVKVLNPLKVPDTASSSMEVLVYAAAGNDYEVQVPSSTPNASFPIIPQMGDGPYDTENQRVEVKVGGYQATPESIDSSAECVGDCFTSVKQLISRYSPVSKLAQVDTSLKTLGVYPHAFNMPWCNVDNPDDLTVPNMSCDIITNIVSGYAFYKGGIRILQTPLAEDSQVCFTVNAPRLLGLGPNVLDTTISPGYVLGASPIYTDIAISHTPAAYQTFDASTGIQEYSVPYYCKTPISLVDPKQSLEHPNIVPWSPQSYVLSYYPAFKNYISSWSNEADAVVTTGNPYIEVQVQRSARDNFQMFYFLGFPPVFVSKTDT